MQHTASKAASTDSGGTRRRTRIGFDKHAACDLTGERRCSASMEMQFGSPVRPLCACEAHCRASEKFATPNQMTGHAFQGFNQYDGADHEREDPV
jgi:hypothetical protein